MEIGGGIFWVDGGGWTSFVGGQLGDGEGG